MSPRTSRREREELPPLDELPALIRVPIAGQFLGWSKSAAYRHADAGHLPVLRMGHQLWVVTAEFRRMLAL